MQYTPTYFDFRKLEFMRENAEIGLTVLTIYAVIFLVAYVYNKVGD